MLKNYIKTTVRNLLHNKVFSVINMLGFSVGIASFILLTLYVFHELSYDRYHAKADRIYRIVENLRTESEMLYQSTSSPPMGPTMEAEFPEVVGYVRFRGLDGMVRRGDQAFFEKDAYFADSSVFDIFSFTMLRGDAKTALVKPYSLVLTAKTARKYFGEEDAVGQSLEIEGDAYSITGVMADVPENSHFTFDMLLSFTTLVSMRPGMEKNEWWYWNGFHTYLLLSEGDHQVENLRRKMPAYIEKYIGKQSREIKMHYEELPLQPLKSIYLETPRSWENGQRGSKSNLYILSIIAVFILGIACFNYVNLSTARASRRLKEVGLRKVLGAQRGALVQQFLGEAVMVSALATVLGLLMSWVLLSPFNDLLGTSLTFEQVPPYGWSGLALLSIMLGVFSGAYPAFMVSGFHPLLIFRNSPRSLYGHQWLRRFLVAGQFMISITLIAGTILVFDQLTLLRTKDLGYVKDATLVIDYNGTQQIRERLESVKDELLRIPGVKAVSAASTMPGQSTTNLYSKIENAEGKITETNINTSGVDPDFIPNFGIKLLAGRNFSKSLPADDTTAFILNAAAIHNLGYRTPSDAIGKQVNQQGAKGTIIGVVDDFRYRSLHYKVEPLLLHANPGWFSKLAVKIESADVTGAVGALNQKWKTLAPDLPFLYSFLDQDYNRLYQSEEKLGKVVSVFSALAIFVACLGLVGLTSFTVQRKVKEIGIRKVLGASVGNLLFMLSTEFFRLIVIAFGLAIPVTYYMISIWLENFTDRITIGATGFLIAGTAVLMIAWLAVSALSLKAARSNPVDSLRSE
jgi:putative ABC transport system permease protein